MNGVDNTTGEQIVSLNASQRHALIDLIEIERTHMSRWWTMLNEMRCRGELPDWVKTQGIGSVPDIDRWLNDCSKTNKALFGRAYVRDEASPEILCLNPLPDLRG